MNEGIPVECFTTDDVYRTCRWPKVMACRPVIGDNVRATDGTTLQVASVTHVQVGWSGPAALFVELAPPVLP